MNNNQKRSGNALLITILLTSVLVLITVGLSRLISNETVQLSEQIKNGKANYLAESGSEIGLYLVHSNPSGFEPNNNDEALKLFPDDENQTFSYQISAKTNYLPILPSYISEEVSRGNLPKNQLFDILSLGESVQIALLPNDSSGNISFAVEYYLGAESNIQNSGDWDILLWKIFGENSEGNIESMSEYFPASQATAGGDFVSNTNVGKSANYPARFGSINNGFNCGNFFPYSPGTETEETSISPTENGENRCQTLIANFLNSHTNNYLILTNAINTTQLQAGDIDKELIANIPYRVCTPNCDTPGYKGLAPIFTQIIAKGNFGTNSKALTTTVNPEGFLPVFDFSIYRTGSN